MNKKRLLKLADYMEKVEARRYNQNAWLTTRNDGSMTEEEVTLRKRAGSDKIIVTVKEGACGTAACLLGNAVAAVPEAKLRFYTDEGEIEREKDGSFTVDAVGIIMFTKDGRELRDYEAGAEAFGIDRSQAHVIFGLKDDYVTRNFYDGDFTPGNVAARIRKFAETGSLNA